MASPLDQRRHGSVRAAVLLLAGGALLPALAAAAEPTATKQADAGRVEATGALARHDVTSAAALRFWITVTNGTSVTVCAVRLIQLEGYDVGALDGAISAPVHSDCAPPPSTGQPVGDARHVIAGNLQPGETATVSGEIFPRVLLYDAQTLHAVVGWTTTAGSRSQALVPLGDIVVEGKPVAWLWYLAPAYQFLKDFALPIVVFLLGFLYKWWTERRETAKQEHEKELEEERLKQDKIQTLRAETWKQMLPESHRLARDYYTPIEGAARWARDAIDACLAQADKTKRLPNERNAFYWLMLLRRRVKAAADQAGGFYFKDRVGEELASGCWNSYLDLSTGGQEAVRRNYERSVAHTAPLETHDAFLARLDRQLDPAGVAPADDPLKDCWNHFCGWYGSASGAESVALLKGFRALVNYEMNRPYEYWYDQKEKERLEIDVPTESLLNQVAAQIEQSDPGKTNFQQQARHYLQEGKGGV